MATDHQDAEESPSPESVPFPPDYGRLLNVAVGLAEFTEKEQAWLEENPKWRRYYDELSAAWRTCQERADNPDGPASRINNSRDGQNGPRSR